MTYFDKDPLSTYKNLKARIPSIKIKNKNFMNRFHNLDMPSDFWWVISGEYAIWADYVTTLSINDPRFLNNLKDTSGKPYSGKTISSSIINIIGKECVFDKDFTLYTGDLKKDIDELLFDNEERHLIIDDEEIKDKNKNIQSVPLLHLTNFLSKLRLTKFQFLFFKIKEKINSIFYDTDDFQAKILNSNDPDKDFELALNLLLPDDMGRFFPKWFLWFSNYFAISQHKWKTFFGSELNIYQKILIAKNYQKYGSKNIKIISHGYMDTFNIWLMWCLSLFPNMKLNMSATLNLPQIHKKILSDDILFCPSQFPWISDFFYIQHFWDFMEVYKSTIKLLNNGLKNGKKIKIRYKSFKYLSGFSAPFIQEQCKIPIEKERFENIYHKYKLIVSMPFGTISNQCYQNSVKCISYNRPFFLTNQQAYLKANTYPGVFKDADKFLNEVENKIKEF
ncbi:MAG: hypothetical protein CBE33_01830 [Candidatus Pelagibacter sp. TMED273]|mgnify:CR=1 FL=1|nr:MAG: hypothetical protein CBE33_01830 [Candidatus Pelagibacter sp. TMED273]|tara:strand:+ start:12037 stop:13383 length:1347 start_codon:yes stop_codon:yes gene_type:complete